MQNHLLQVVAHLAMEPPVAADADSLRDEKAKVFKAIRTATPADLVRGQYRGYRGEAGVAPTRTSRPTPRCASHIDSWRWAGVPFYLRSGKCLDTTVTEVVVTLKRPPHTHVPGATTRRTICASGSGPTRVAIALGAAAKRPGPEMRGREVELDRLQHGQRGSRRVRAAHRRGAARSDRALFAREDGVLEAWRIVDPLLSDRAPRRMSTSSGSTGPGSGRCARRKSAGGWRSVHDDLGELSVAHAWHRSA